MANSPTSTKSRAIADEIGVKRWEAPPASSLTRSNRGGEAIAAELSRLELTATAPSRALLEAEWERVDPEGVAALRASAAAMETTAPSAGGAQ